MRQKDLIKKMDAEELKDWMAYDMLSDKEFKTRMMMEIQLEDQQGQSSEEEARRVIDLFTSFGMSPPPEQQK